MATGNRAPEPVARLAAERLRESPRLRLRNPVSPRGSQGWRGFLLRSSIAPRRAASPGEAALL